MKKIINMIIFLSLIITVNAQDRRILNIDTIYQEETNWCWAACTQMILNYYNISRSQCEIAEIARVIDRRNYYIHHPNGQSNYFGSSNCCGLSNHCDQVNKLYTNIYSEPGSKGGINTILDSLNISNSYISSSLHLSELKNEIDNWNPVILRWGWVGTNDGHFVVVRGYDITLECIYYSDPATTVNYPGGANCESYNWIIENIGETYHHEWTATMVLNTQPSCGHSKSWFNDPITTNVNCSETDIIELSSSISNNSTVDINFGKECLLNNGFGNAIGSSITIMPVSTLNCN